MRVLVTGATGFVGRHVVKALLGWGVDEVRALVRDPLRERLFDGMDVDIHYGSVTDRAALRSAMIKADAVVHLAAIIRESPGRTFDLVNHRGTWNVVAVAKGEGVSHLVHMSVLGAVNSQRSPYLYSRWLGEQEVVKSGIPYTVLRPSLLFGPGDEFINTLAGLAKALPVMVVPGSGKVRFQVLSVEDLAQCVALTVGNDRLKGKVIELGGPAYLTFDQIIDTFLATWSLRRLKLHVPIPIMRLLVAAMKLLPRPPITQRQLDLIDKDNLTRLKTLEDVFGFAPRPLEGNIEYIKGISRWDGFRIVLGFMPRHIRDH